jgi:leucyl-tRNA synthetase
MVIRDGAKMSKSLGNVVSPDEMVARYGADAARLYSLFAAPPDRDLDWQDAGIEGIQRFLSRVYRFVVRNASRPADSSGVSERRSLPPSGRTPEAEALPATSLPPEARAIQRKLHQTIKRVSDDFQGRWHFNTSIAAIMELVNELYGVEGAQASGLRTGSMSEKLTAPLLAEVQRDLVLLLAPFAPYLAHELWEMLGEESNLLRVAWPKYDAVLAKEEEVEIPVQINGKLRSRVIVAVDAPEDTIIEGALADEKIRAAIVGKQIVKTIVVPGKLLNIVVR